ncbi:PASTA domain-containing protein [uncultured Eubacterium sp.]|uniref:PASTA domain-containing protein n=1 Tax=uncultured Eubacterium sp. TaxID=165185 RepID=UPI00261BDD0D|nr:PASTA domain-containing protein [uncultured Eubacterium sp.]
MRDLDNLCANCWEELTEGSVCAECGYDNDTQNDSVYLKTKTVIAGQYVIGNIIKIESDSVTYSGYDGQLDKPILIREFFPKGIASRFDDSDELHVRQKYVNDFARYKKSFYNLWTTMQKLHNLSAVVPVYDLAEANGTYYAIIEKTESVPLREYLLRNEEGYILWDTARLMFMPVLTTIEALHSNGIVHGSITPDNLVLCRDGKVHLAPFPITEASDQATAMEFTENDGYTALEQYNNKHRICAATDIYSFSACIYRALVGSNPPSAVSREANDKLMIPNTIAEKIPMHVIKALVNGLQIYPEKRVKTVEDFRELLDAAPAVKAKAAVEQEDIYQKGAKGGYPEYNESNGDKKRKAVVAILIILIVAAIAAAVYVVQFSGLIDNGKNNTTTTQPVKTYQVPNFSGVGYTQSDIENNGAWNEQFKFTFQGEYSADTEEGIIFKQSVAAGETVDQGSEIILTVSKGIQTQTVPDVRGLVLDEATKQLEDLGFKVSTVEVYNDGTHVANTVKNTDASAPAAGTLAAVGEEVILQVYGEAEPTTAPAATDSAEQ